MDMDARRTLIRIVLLALLLYAALCMARLGRELHAAQNTAQRLASRLETVELENLSGSRKEITLNGVAAVLEPSERKKVRCPARIPAEKAGFFDPDYLDEPKIDMKDTSTPY